MHRLAAVLFLSLLLSPVACDKAEYPSAEDPQPHTVRFSSIVDAREARQKLQSEGAEVSDRIRFVEDAWTFTSSQPYEPEPPMEPEPSGDCDTTGKGPLGPGSTACDLRTDAEREQKSMVEDGWDCSAVVRNDATGKWEFTWVKEPSS